MSQYYSFYSNNNTNKKTYSTFLNGRLHKQMLAYIIPSASWEWVVTEDIFRPDLIANLWKVDLSLQNSLEALFFTCNLAVKLC